MQTKLTLRIDDQLVRQAKRHAKLRGKSVSQMVADFFLSLEQTNRPPPADLPPVTRKLNGLLSGTRADETDYLRHLVEKHL